MPTAVVLAFVGCRSAPPPAARAPESQKQTAGQEPPVTPPADVSHGEAPVGSDSIPAPVDPQAPARSRERLHRVRLEITHASITITKGVKYYAWTFGGGVPGPFIRVTQGDTVDFTLVNKGPQPHSMDFHAAEIAPSRYYVNVNPGDSLHYRFTARVPGVFMYHCGTAPVAMHIANGMYGALIVDPPTPRPPAREFVVVQSEFYLTPDDAKGSMRSLDWQKLLGQAPDYVVFNGRVAQYAEHPIAVKPGELLRLYVVNAGPNRISSFHVVGGIFEKVFEDGSLTNPLRGVQTVNVPVGGGAIFEIRLREPGDYPFVTHAFADATKGAVGVFRAGTATSP
jgi:nitrite reductase (NO-forming)